MSVVLGVWESVPTIPHPFPALSREVVCDWLLSMIGSSHHVSTRQCSVTQWHCSNNRITLLYCSAVRASERAEQGSGRPIEPLFIYKADLYPLGRRPWGDLLRSIQCFCTGHQAVLVGLYKSYMRKGSAPAACAAGLFLVNYCVF